VEAQPGPVRTAIEIDSRAILRIYPTLQALLTELGAGRFGYPSRDTVNLGRFLSRISAATALDVCQAGRSIVDA
jgi:hypothetical protein